MDSLAQNTPKFKDIAKKKGVFMCIKISKPFQASKNVILTKVFKTFVALFASHVIWQIIRQSYNNHIPTHQYLEVLYNQTYLKLIDSIAPTTNVIIIFMNKPSNSRTIPSFTNIIHIGMPNKSANI